MKNLKHFAIPIIFSAFAVAGLATVAFATVAIVSVEPVAEEGALMVQDASASGGEAVQFSTEGNAFTFAAAGDFTDSTAAGQVFDSIALSESDFMLALGDLGYVDNGNEQQWCDFVNSRVGGDFPVQLVAGNHDDETSGDGDIIEYRKCLPNRIGEIDGDYAIEYSFDYQDLARFIMISPDIRNYGADYDEGDSHYQWVKDQVEGARQNDLKWVVLGMHKNCISPGIKSCEIGEDILNLAIESGVDVILQGHEHGYFRSKQLSFSANCPAIVVNEYNADCVAAENGDFTSGEGSVIVISGAGGIGLRDIDLNDPDREYFEAVSAKNVEPTHGYAHFQVSEQSIVKTFIGVNGDFEDSFSINYAGE